VHRNALLIAGPFVLMTGFYFLIFSGAQEGRASANAVRLSPPEPFKAPPEIKSRAPKPRLQTACETKAAWLRTRISIPVNVLIQTPYVIVGDYEVSTLEALYQKAISPTEYALNVSYFDTPPDRPITIVALSSQEHYQQVAMDLDQRKTGSYYGYFQSNDMRIVLNLSTGGGTLGHELTHVLAEIDYPAMPEWFDEGLASLHEQCEFSDEQTQLIGISNWRGQLLLSALDRNQLPPLSTLVEQVRIDTRREALTYAYARYFCLYLQQKRLLSPFYRKLRTSQEYDDTGGQTLKQLLNINDLSDIDEDFRLWLTGFRQLKTPADTSR
tara:strand:+ start:35352 stop:36329 length:978 start_codon:yes stop_codon:yes gene_type:complete